ncbi:hypothetical protein [Streptomyces sp. SM1]|uniref:hypothetical protein n=1 Tax=Streptomyces sp. SM1 TaxID=402229 RepID=UPI000CD4F730|nr:hypothetical protein [Streptomyces sp. SM1]
MSESTQPTTTEDTPTAYGLCHWHQGYASGIRLINAIEQGSGSGITHFACGPCRELHRLTPFADR